MALFLVVLLASVGCTVSPAPDDDAGDDDASAPTCIADHTACDGSTFYRCGADGRTRLDEVACDEACDPIAGCVHCVVGSHRCSGDVSERCGPDHRWARLRDCRAWDSACGDDGFCDDACAVPEREGTYTGCELQVVALPGRGDPVSVVLANAGDTPSEVEIRRDGVLDRSVIVAPRAVSVVQLGLVGPGSGSSIGRASVAWLHASAPVIATQFQPYEATGSFSADASLLSPRHGLGHRHVVASYLPLSAIQEEVGGDRGRSTASGTLTIVAPPDEGASVAITPTAPIHPDPSARIPALAPGETFVLALAPGEAAHLRAATPPPCGSDREGWTTTPRACVETGGGTRCFDLWVCLEPAYDLTGTLVDSDRPVAVFGGHELAFVPFDRVAGDRLEEQLPPVETWGYEHVSLGLGPDGGPGPNQIRVIAAHDGTEVVIDPAPGGGAAEVTLDAGEWIEREVHGAFRVVGSKPVMVAQYLWGQGPPAEGGRGDPSMWIVPPVEQYRSDYGLSLPADYLPEANGAHYLVIARPRGSWVAIDGIGIPDTLGGTVGDWDVGVIPAEAGVHQVLGAQPFSLVTIGMADYTSYATPGGRDLRPILR